MKIRKCGLHGCVCRSPPLQSTSDFFPFEPKETKGFLKLDKELYLSVV